MNRVQSIKIDRDKSNIIHKILGVLFILLALILLIPYIFAFLKITVAILLIALGIYFLTKETRFRWFRIRRF
ncbi:MAG: hypothetical protein ACLFN8_03660 [Candidatus Woesearchaeota archaeon]